MLLKLQLFGRNGAALAPVYCCKMPHNIQLTLSAYAFSAPEDPKDQNDTLTDTRSG